MVKTWFFYFTVFVTGAVILMLEILGTRILSPFYGSTIYVWSSLIIATLLFLALGYFCGGRLADKRPEVDLLYWAIFFAGITILLIPKYSNWLLDFSYRFGFKWGPLLSALLLFCTPLFLLGMVSPLAVRIRAQTLNNLGITVGGLYAVATLGSLFGALAVGFFLIPHLAVTHIVYMTGIILVLLFLLWRGQSLRKFGKGFLSFVVFIVLFFASLYFIDFSAGGRLPNVVYHTQSFYGDIRVMEFGPIMCVFVDNVAQSCIDREKGQSKSFAREISGIIQQNKPRTALILGMGGGSFLLDVPRDTAIDVVEIDPQIVKVAERYDLIPEREYNIYYDDARSFIKNVDKRYDLVAMDLFIGGNIPFYMLSLEAFKEIKDILTKDGMLYIHLPALSRKEENIFLHSVYKTLTEVFEEVEVISIPSMRSNGVIAGRFPIKTMEVKSLDSHALAKAEVVTDDFNPLETYYLPQFISLVSYYDRTFGRFR